MIRLPTILLLSTLTAFGQSSFIRVNTTNDLVGIFIPAKNAGLVAVLAGSTNINSGGIGGMFLCVTNSAVAVDWLHVFPFTNTHVGRWIRIQEPIGTNTAGNINVAGTTTTATLSVGGNAVVGGTMHVVSTSALDGNVTAGADVTATGTVTGAAVSSAGTIVGGGNLHIVGTSALDGNITNAALTASKGVFTSSAKVLTSTGTLGPDQGGSGAGTFTKGILVSPGTTTAFTTVAGTTGYFPYWSSSYPTTTSPLWTDGSYVGFGTVIPQAAADIRNGNLFFSQTGLAHGVTDYLNTTVGVQFAILGATNGGGLLRAIAADPTYEGILVQAISATSPTATTIVFQGLKHGAGGTAVALAAGEKVFQVKNSGTAMITTLGSGTSIMPGLHVGAATDPGANNITADGTITGAALSSGGAITGAGNIHVIGTSALDGAITNAALTASRLVYSDAAKVLTSVDVPASNGYVLTGNTDGTVAWAVNAGASFADPGTSITLSQQNGVATTAMRSDAAPALNQNIAPVWTAAHIWTSPVTTFGSTADYDASPVVQHKYDMEVTSGSSVRTTLAKIEAGKENATSGNNAGYYAIRVRPNGGSDTEYVRVASGGTVGVKRSLYVGSTTGSDPGDNNILAEGDMSAATVSSSGAIVAGGTLHVVSTSALDSTITAAYLTASKFVKTDGSKNLVSADITAANLVGLYQGPHVMTTSLSVASSDEVILVDMANTSGNVTLTFPDGVNGQQLTVKIISAHITNTFTIAASGTTVESVAFSSVAVYIGQWKSWVYHTTTDTWWLINSGSVD